MSFWEHLEVLRGVLLRAVAVALVCTLAAFLLKDALFAVVMAPARDVSLINTQLTGQFAAHVTVAVYAGIVMASPYIIYVLLGFISPGLYAGERRLVVRVVAAGYVLFMAGVVLDYLLIFPLTVRFLASYTVTDDVVNMIALSSYIDTLAAMSLMMGIVAETPVLCWLLAKMGLVDAAAMRSKRKHAIVAMLTVAAVITPTQDVLTLLLVACPMIVLYEVSIWIVKGVK